MEYLKEARAMSSREGYYDSFHNRTYCLKCAPPQVVLSGNIIHTGQEWADFDPSTCHECGHKLDVQITDQTIHCT